MPIQQATLRNKRDFADPHVTYAFEFEEWQAAKEAHLDLWEWENGRFPVWFRAKVVAHYQAVHLIEQHAQDAAITLNNRKKK